MQPYIYIYIYNYLFIYEHIVTQTVVGHVLELLVFMSTLLCFAWGLGREQSSRPAQVHCLNGLTHKVLSLSLFFSQPVFDRLFFSLSLSLSRACVCLPCCFRVPGNLASKGQA